MGFKPSYLWAAPEINPINKKARSVPIFNVINIYGRVFFFSWFSFMIAFWSWYAFPPLLHDVIAKDILSPNKAEQQAQVANSNIVALCATLLVRLVAGPCCDRFGPRWTFAGCLLLGAIPTFLAGAVFNAPGLLALRFFVGILGGSFVPCQVWTTGFYDKNIVGTANSLTAGLGNAGGGITYFVMPAIYESLVGDGLRPHVAWRVTFIVPGILIVTAAVTLLLFCPDTPTGKWSERLQAAENNLRRHSIDAAIVDIPGRIGDSKRSERSDSGAESPQEGAQEEKKLDQTRGTFGDHEAQLTEQQMLDTARGEVIQKPSFKDVLRIMISPQTLVCGAAYFCSFGSELAVNSILGSFYRRNFPNISLQQQGNLAAMFGLMNVLWRPLGGVVSDIVYNATGNVWSKKILIHVYGLITGAFLVAIGATDPHSLPAFVCLIGIGMAFFLEGSNGLVYSLVPHVHPHANGVVSGVAGASGNFGGIIFAIIFRYQGTDYPKTFWVMGIIIMAIHVLTCWIKPIPKGQIGGR